MIDIVRSKGTPASLKTTRSYSGDDVRERLIEDFFDKCYLCEGKLYGDFQVEHLRPKADFKARAQDWKNLFPAHGDTCNQRRLRWDNRSGQKVGWPPEGLLDCAGGENVEARLRQWFTTDVGDINVFFAAADETDQPAANTARELQHIHTGSSAKARKIRQLIQSQLTRSHQAMTRFFIAVHGGDTEQRLRAAAEFRRLTSRQAPYTALLRSYFERELTELPAPLRQQLGLGAPAEE